MMIAGNSGHSKIDAPLAIAGGFEGDARDLHPFVRASLEPELPDLFEGPVKLACELMHVVDSAPVPVDGRALLAVEADRHEPDRHVLDVVRDP